MPRSHPIQADASWLIRWKWRWLQWGGWTIEGPLPNGTEPVVLLMGNHLGPNDPMSNFVLACLPAPCAWVQEDNPDFSLANPGNNIWMMHHQDAGTSSVLLTLAQDLSAPVQLVQLNAKSKRIWFNSHFFPGRFPSRTQDYIERILSQSVR